MGGKAQHPRRVQHRVIDITPTVRNRRWIDVYLHPQTLHWKKGRGHKRRKLGTRLFNLPKTAEVPLAKFYSARAASEAPFTLFFGPVGTRRVGIGQSAFCCGRQFPLRPVAAAASRYRQQLAQSEPENADCSLLSCGDWVSTAAASVRIDLVLPSVDVVLAYASGQSDGILDDSGTKSTQAMATGIGRSVVSRIFRTFGLG